MEDNCHYIFQIHPGNGAVSAPVLHTLPRFSHGTPCPASAGICSRWLRYVVTTIRYRWLNFPRYSLESCSSCMQKQRWLPIQSQPTGKLVTVRFPAKHSCGQLFVIQRFTVPKVSTGSLLPWSPPWVGGRGVCPWWEVPRRVLPFTAYLSRFINPPVLLSNRTL